MLLFVGQSIMDGKRSSHANKRRMKGFLLPLALGLTLVAIMGLGIRTFAPSALRHDVVRAVVIGIGTCSAVILRHELSAKDQDSEETPA